MDRALIVLLAVVLLAGCSGLSTVGEDTTTMTPAPVPSPSETATETNILPPGVTGNGVTNVDLLADAHQRAILNRSYTWNARRVVLNQSDGGRTGDDVRQTAHVENEMTYSYWTNHQTIWRDGRPRQLGNFMTYAGPTGGYVRYKHTEANTQYRSFQPPPARVSVGGNAMSAIEQYLQVEAATLSKIRTEDTLLYELRGNGTQAVVDSGTVTNYTVRALIKPDGFVRSLDVRYQRRDNGQRQVVEFTYSYESLGETTVDRPAWVDREWGAHTETTRSTETGR